MDDVPLMRYCFITHLNNSFHIFQGEYPCHGRPSSYKELYDTFQQCCERQTWWLTDCSLPYHDADGNRNSGLWYVKYETNGLSKCTRDCYEGTDENCGGKAEEYDELYETFNECCETRLWWQQDCAAYDENGSGEQYSVKYFTNYETASCQQVCEPSDDGFVCKKVSRRIALFDSVQACCDIGQPWVDISYCVSRSVSSYSEGWVVNYEESKCGES